AVAEARATLVSPIVLHLRPGAREWFMQWLQTNHPALVPRYQRLYARGAYAPREHQDEVSSRVQGLAARFGGGSSQPRDARRVREGRAGVAAPGPGERAPPR